jgi:uncharacterized protein (TIGR03437 family)
MQVLVNGDPATITAGNGSQINFIAGPTVNMMPLASVQLVYDDPVDSSHFESNVVWMPTADRWFNLFESNGYAAATHSGGFFGPNNPLHQDDVLVLYGAGAGSLGDDSIGADELTNSAHVISPAPQVQAILEGGMTFDLSVDYFGNSPGSTPALGQFNVRHPQEFWTFCAAQTNVEYTLRVTDTVPMSGQYIDPFGVPAEAVTDTQAFATCP